MSMSICELAVVFEKFCSEVSSNHPMPGDSVPCIYANSLTEAIFRAYCAGYSLALKSNKVPIITGKGCVNEAGLVAAFNTAEGFDDDITRH